MNLESAGLSLDLFKDDESARLSRFPALIVLIRLRINDIPCVSRLIESKQGYGRVKNRHPRYHLVDKQFYGSLISLHFQSSWKP